MIFEVIKILALQVEDYFDSIGANGNNQIRLDNVAAVDSQSDNGQNLDNRLLLSLINISEEGTMKNFPNNPVENGRVQLQQPKINLNLYLLFSANRNSYERSLKDISTIVEFFQGKKVFTQSNTIYNRNNVELQGIDNFKFHVELYTPTFEELNYIWGSLGGRQIPSALYKLSVVNIERRAVLSEAGLITELNRDLKHK